MRSDLAIQIELPFHALGDGFDHEIALGEPPQVLFVVGCFDQASESGQREGGR